MAEPTKLTTVAPSAAPGTAPAEQAVTAAPPSNGAATEPTTFNDFVELARKSLAGEPAQAATPATEPLVTGQEPSPEPAGTEPAEPTLVVEDAEAVEDATAPEDTTTWTEGEKRLHGALEKERQESKDARAAVRELKAKLAELESKITTPTAPQAEPATPAAQTAPPPSGTGMLADCLTFDAVDARAQEAAATESQAVRLQNMLNRNGAEPVVERLKASGVDTIGGKPIAEADADQVGEFLASVYEGARMAQAQAPARKAWLAQNQQSLAAAVKILPELNDAKSAAFQAASKIVSENPLLRNRADWPVIVAKLYLGEQAYNSKATGNGAGTPRPTAPKVTSRPAPGAPRTSTAAMPPVNGSVVLAKKMADGTATLDEVQSYTLSKMSV